MSTGWAERSAGGSGQWNFVIAAQVVLRWQGRTCLTMEVHMHKGLIVLISALGIAACGGGGGGSGGGFATPEDAVRTLTGSQPPLETEADMAARAPGIVSRSDSLISSTVYGNTSHPDVPTFEFRASCSGISCTFREPRSGYTDNLTVRDLSFRTVTEKIALSKHGITLHGGSENGFKVYGSWMRHSGFQVTSHQLTAEGIDFQVRNGLAGGDLTGYAPNSSASWRGVMVGTPATGANRGDFLQGDALLVYDFLDATLDADFANIKNIDKNRAHTVTRIGFDEVPMYTDGTFMAGLSGNRIQGGFYGPNHAEAAGVFEQQNVVGSFGAKKR